MLKAPRSSLGLKDFVVERYLVCSGSADVRKSQARKSGRDAKETKNFIKEPGVKGSLRLESLVETPKRRVTSSKKKN